MTKKRRFGKDKEITIHDPAVWESWRGFNYNGLSPERGIKGAHHSFPFLRTDDEKEKFVSDYLRYLLAKKPRLAGHHNWLFETTLRQVYAAEHTTTDAIAAPVFALPQEMPRVIDFLTAFKDAANKRLLRGTEADVTRLRTFDAMKEAVDRVMNEAEAPVRPQETSPSSLKKNRGADRQP